MEAPKDRAGRTGMVVLNEARYALVPERLLPVTFQEKTSLVFGHVMSNQYHIRYLKRLKMKFHLPFPVLI